MPRLIDADALIKDMDGDLLDGIAEARAIEKIENAPTINEWINVKDRLPTPSKMVLFTGKTCYGTWLIAQCGWYDGTFWHRDTEEAIYSSTPVTYWMPLPEPPEENENNGNA